MINVAVKPGWAGGAWHIKDFLETLSSQGFNITSQEHADVVVAHSIACYDLQVKSPATYYILLDPPYWPGRPLISRFFEKQLADNARLKNTRGWQYLLQKLGWGLFYIISNPRYTYLALTAKGNLDFLKPLEGRNVLIVRNHEDMLCTPEIKVALAAYPWVYYFELPGEHDDYYTNPAPYVHLLPKKL